MSASRIASMLAIAATALVPAVACAATDAELAKIREQIRQIKDQYETRIRALEDKLQAAEARAAASRSAVATAPPAPAPTPEAMPNAGSTASGASMPAGSATSGGAVANAGSNTTGGGLAAFNPAIS